eukprot:scaffold9707_cov79-Isochrysis_galbana.AAC.1
MRSTRRRPARRPSRCAGTPQRPPPQVSSVADDLVRLLPFSAMVFMILMILARNGGSRRCRARATT